MKIAAISSRAMPASMAAAGRAGARPRRRGPEPSAVSLVDRISDAVGSNDDRPWRTQYVKRLKPGTVDRALGQLKEARQHSSVRNPGGLLTKIVKDIAIKAGIAHH